MGEQVSEAAQRVPILDVRRVVPEPLLVHVVQVFLDDLRGLPDRDVLVSADRAIRGVEGSLDRRKVIHAAISQSSVTRDVGLIEKEHSEQRNSWGFELRSRPNLFH